jgi:hypothetical protein
MATEEVTCPSGLVVRVSNLKLRQIKRLSDRAGLRSGKVFQDILQELAVDVLDPGPYSVPASGFDWRLALQGDRLVALLAIRCATHGSSFDFDVECSRCAADEPVRVTVDLRAMRRAPYPPETIEAFREGRPCSAVIAGKRVSWAHMTGAEEQRVQASIKARKESHPKGRKGREAGGDPLIDALLARLKVDGVGPRQLEGWLDDLDGDEVARLNTAMQDQLGGVDTTIRVRHDAADCGGVTLVELPFYSTDFWLPRTSPTTPEEPKKKAEELPATKDVAA